MMMMNTLYRPPSLSQSHPNFHFLFVKLQMRCTLNETILAKSRRKEETNKQFKTSFNYCSSGSGQNSVIPVVFIVPE